ncbi:MAG TPA: hypothetical protein VKZ69_04430 [Limnochordales bacterium]|nr:hypothetical protein [Limnochordales bacterium]
MKRCPALVVAVVGAVLAGAAVASAQAATQFFPLADGNWWQYTGSGLDLRLAVAEAAGGQFVVSTEINDFVVQREYYAVIGDDVVALRREFPQGSFALEPPQLFLKTPFSAGQQWTWAGRVAGQTARLTFSVLEADTVQTPAGTFVALPVAVRGTVDGEELYTMRWFAAGIGMVREQAQVMQQGQAYLIDLRLAAYHVK